MTEQKKKLAVTAAIIAAAVILAVVGYIILPETLVTQISASGQPSSTMPKLLGLGLPFALSVIFALLYYKGEKKNLLVSLLGLVVFVLTFVFNYKAV